MTTTTPCLSAHCCCLHQPPTIVLVTQQSRCSEPTYSFREARIHQFPPWPVWRGGSGPAGFGCSCWGSGFDSGLCSGLGSGLCSGFGSGFPSGLCSGPWVGGGGGTVPSRLEGEPCAGGCGLGCSCFGGSCLGGSGLAGA